jgi:RNA polymerase sigma-70 factor (ECF subfamily)
MEKSDIKLIEDAKKDPKKYDLVYRKYAKDVFNYIWYRVGHNYEVAEDLTQEVFMRAFQHLDKFRQRGYAYRTYLLTIAKNVLVNYFKKTKSTISLNELTEIPDEITVDQQVERKIAATNLWRAVQNLSHNERDAILMYYRKDTPIKDISRIMGKSPNAVKIILSRGRKKLKNHPYLKDIIHYGDVSYKYTKPRFLYGSKG